MKSVLLILWGLLTVAGWYGYWAKFTTGYNAGRLSCLNENQAASYQKGFDSGKDLAKREFSMESQSTIDAQVNTQVQAARNEMLTKVQANIGQLEKSAYDKGAGDEAKLIFALQQKGLLLLPQRHATVPPATVPPVIGLSKGDNR